MTTVPKQSKTPDPVKYKLIFNPKAGRKRSVLHFHKNPDATLEQVQFLLEKYQIVVDLAPTKRAGHAKELAQEAIKQGYKAVLVAGGDGTVGEAANGLIGSDIPLGILPLGSFMNIARMLSIPNDLEKAVALIKIGRTRKIDIGKVTHMGEKLTEPYFFLESSGVGWEAQVHESVRKLENGEFGECFKIIKTFIDFYTYSVDVEVDDQKIHSKASAVTVSNGAFSGAALKLAPEAKLNDHRLTVSVYKMTKYELLRFFINLFYGRRKLTQKIKTYQGLKVALKTKRPRMVHADARVFGETPAQYEIIPNALNVITGFPDPGEAYLNPRQILDP